MSGNFGNRQNIGRFSFSLECTNPYNQPMIASPPTDTISEICWCPDPGKLYLCASSWDNTVSAWGIRKVDKLESKKLVCTKHSMPALCVFCTRDGRIFSGGCDNTCRISSFPGVNLGRGNMTSFEFGKHDDCVKTIHHVQEKNLVISGGWDKKVKYWDGRMRNNQPIHTESFPERIYCSDVKDNLYLGCCGGTKKEIGIIDLRQPKKLWRVEASDLRLQTRCCKILPNKNGYCLGSIEGRVSVRFFPNCGKSFSFKCHREGISATDRNKKNCFAVNDLSFHPKFGTLTTCGSNGRFNIWDVKNQKLVYYLAKKFTLPLLQGKWSPDGSIYASAVGYDFSLGTEVDVFKKNNHSSIVLQCSNNTLHQNVN